jgi:cell division protein FtsN
MSAELKAEDRDWNLERVERFLQERNTETEGEGLSEFDDETYQMARDLKKRKKSRILPIVTAIGALTVFGGVVWYAYNWNQGQISPDALPVVVAEAGPIKEQPAEEGGLEIPYRDRAVMNDGLDGEEAKTVEHLLPPPEEPAVVQSSNDTTASAGEQTAMASVTATDGDAEPSASSQTNETAATASTQTVAAAPSVVAPEPAETAAGAGADAASGTGSAAKATEQTQAAAAPAADKPKSETTAQVPTDSGYFLQLASVQDRSNVESEWKRLQKMFPALLGDMSLQIEEALVNGKTFFRLKTGPFPNRATAEDVCAQLKTKKQACLLKKQG